MENVGYNDVPGFGGVGGQHYNQTDPRVTHFQDGFQNSRSIQPIPFRPTSVLHQLTFSPNGFGQQDAQRRIFNGKNVSLLPTMNGVSSQTYQKEQQFNPFRQIGV